MSYGAGSSGSGRISTAADAALSNPASNDVLMYDATVQKWRNAPVTQVNGELARYGTSSDLKSFGTGPKYFALAAPAAFVVGEYVRVFRAADASLYMAGLITQRDSNGAGFTINAVENTGGSVTATDWVMVPSGQKGAPGTVDYTVTGIIFRVWTGSAWPALGTVPNGMRIIWYSTFDPAATAPTQQRVGDIWRRKAAN